MSMTSPLSLISSSRISTSTVWFMTGPRVPSTDAGVSSCENVMVPLAGV